ncbi:hypothetical protein LEJE111609_04715 [Lelliottia jeotgali]
MINKPLFTRNAATVAGHRAVYTDNSVARNDDSHPVCTIGGGHCAYGIGLINLFCKRLIVRRFPVRNGA